MDHIVKNLLAIKEILEKGTFMPSPKGPKLPKLPEIPSPNNQKTSPLVPGSKKNPVKVAQQIEDPGKKIQAMNTAKETLKLSKNGQWSLD